jgi:hypothetical protein
MTWHPEVMGVRQQRALAQLGPFMMRRGFYLAGGTAVALHLGHRRSVDLDWLTSEELSDPMRLAHELRAAGIAFVIGQVAPGTLHGSIGNVRVSFLEYRYPLLRSLRSWRRQSRIASRPDLAAMKLSAVAQRGAKKDFVDIFALGRRSRSLRQMLRWYQEKFAVRDVAHLLFSLAYFDDADRERLPPLLWDNRWKSIKSTIRDWVRSASN